MSEIIKGGLIAKNIREKTKLRIEKLSTPPGLAAILVGRDPASKVYVSLKEEAAKEAGVYIEKIVLPAKTPTKEIVKVVKALNDRPDINGILVQLPLPIQNEDKVIFAIDPAKDVDGFHPKNREMMKKGQPTFYPPVALAIMRLIQETHQPLHGKSAVVIGNNPIFAEPIMKLMHESSINGQFLPSDESALGAKVRTADIVVTAVGEPGYLTQDMVKPGAIVIDVGTTKVNGKLKGDANDNLIGHAGFISPVPGGVGPLTVAYLINNVLKSALGRKVEK